MCKQVLGTIPSVCAMALTPMGERVFPRSRKIAIARDTAGTGRMRGARSMGLLVWVTFFIGSNYIIYCTNTTIICI